jgi:hypothetical protein
MLSQILIIIRQIFTKQINFRIIEYIYIQYINKVIILLSSFIFHSIPINFSISRLHILIIQN